MQRRPFMSGTSAALAVTALLVLSACSDADPKSSPEPREGATSSIPTLEPGEPSEVPLEETQSWLTRGDLPAPSDLVLADALDTNAPVDAASLPDGVTPAQVQALRQAWSERASSLADLESAAAADPTTGGACEALSGDVWALYLPTQDAAPVVALGVTTDNVAECDWSDALVLVDSATNTVLGDEAVALLM